MTNHNQHQYSRQKLRTVLSGLVNSRPAILIRIIALFSCAIWLVSLPILTAISYAQSTNRSTRDELSNHLYLQDIQNEHRFSVLETKVNAIDERTSFISNTMWAVVIGMSGLLGERGVSLIRRKKVSLSELSGESNEED